MQGKSEGNVRIIEGKPLMENVRIYKFKLIWEKVLGRLTEPGPKT